MLRRYLLEPIVAVDKWVRYWSDQTTGWLVLATMGAILAALPVLVAHALVLAPVWLQALATILVPVAVSRYMPN